MKQIQQIVEQMGRENEFSSVVLTDTSGFPFASFSPDGSGDAPAAVAAMLQRVAEQAKAHVRMSKIAEVDLYDDKGYCLACRQFTANGHTLILAMRVPPNKPYRRLARTAIRQIQQLWSFGS